MSKKIFRISKRIVTGSFFLGLIVVFTISSYASVPKAWIVAPSETVPEVSSYTVTLNISSTALPTTIACYYRKQGTTDWTAIVSTGPSYFPYNWNITLDNNTVYELKAVATNADGTDPSPLISWFRVERDPQVGLFRLYIDSYTNTQVPTSAGKSYVKAYSPLWIAILFEDINTGAKQMDTSVTSTITITPQGKTAVSPTKWEWFASSYLARIDITATTGDGEAMVSVSGAKDTFGNTMDAFNITFVIDTLAPSIVKVEVDEDGDTGLIPKTTDNNGYVQKGERPRVYITFSEPMDSVKYASFTPAGMSAVGANLEGWQDAKNTIYKFRFPTAVDNTTGDGWCAFRLERAIDIAGNEASVYTNTQLFYIDGTLPQAPIITAPVEGSAVDPGSIVSVTLQDPTDTDIKYAEFSYDGGVTWPQKDFTKPYQVARQVSAVTIQARYVDKADNQSAPTQVTVTLNPVVDKTAPLARIILVDNRNFPNVISSATVNDANANIQKVEFQYSSDGTNWTSIGTDAVNSDGFSVVWNVSNLTSGNYYLRAIATDINSNADSAPSIANISISKEASNVSITSAIVKSDTIYNIQASLDTTNKKVDISINSQNQPTVAVQLWDVVTSSFEWILPGQITVSGSAGNWTASATSDFITDGTTYGTVFASVKDADGQVIQRQCELAVVKFDAEKGIVFNLGTPYGVGINISSNALKSNTNLVVKTVQAPTYTQEGIVQLGQVYDFSFADGTKNFAPITLIFNYPNLGNTGNMFPNSNAEKTKLTVCYWDGSKWTRDKNIIHYVAEASSINVKTSHFSKFSIVADYAKPKISDVKVNGRVVTIKGTDEGSGISNAASNLTVNGVAYAPVYNPDTDDLVFRGTGLVDEGDYPYVLRLQDNVGNYSEVKGVISYSPKLALADAHNYPNPFDPDKEDTTIRLTLSEDAYITIKIYDFNGDLVSVVTRNDTQLSGARTWRWGGTNDNGDKVANGTYFCEITASGSLTGVGRTVREVIKVAVLRRK